MAGRTTTSKPAAKQADTPVERLAATTLTAEVLRELRRPFTVQAIRFKPQVVSKGDGPKRAMATFYIDARLAAERLNTVVGPEHWSDTYRVLFEADAAAHAKFQFPVECSLTVFDVTKVDVGVYQSSAADDKAVKSAYSDALKRAAVKFGVGAYLYGFPKVWAEVKVGQNGKAQGFTDAGEKVLRHAYETALAQIADRFGGPIDHGDLSDPETADGAPPEEAAADPTPPAAARETKAADLVGDFEEIKRMVALAKEAGFSEEQIKTVCRNEHEAHSGYRKSWLREQLQQLNKAIEARAAA